MSGVHNDEWWKRAYGSQSGTYQEETLNSQIALSATSYRFGPPIPAAEEAPDRYVDVGWGVMKSDHQHLKIMPDKYRQKLSQADWAKAFLP